MTRQVNTTSDLSPSVGQQYNAKILRPFIKSGSTILDIGCWTGQLFRAISGKKDLRYYGVDVSLQAIVEAKNASKAGQWSTGSALSLPYKDKMFDVVTLLDVIEHLPKGSEEQCLNEMKRVMKVGGRAIFCTPANNFMSIVFDPAFFISGHRHYDLKVLKNLFSKTGFIIEKSWITGGIVYASQYLFHLFAKHLFKIYVQINGELAKRDIEKERGFLTHYIVAKRVC